MFETFVLYPCIKRTCDLHIFRMGWSEFFESRHYSATRRTKDGAGIGLYIEIFKQKIDDLLKHSCEKDPKL